MPSEEQLDKEMDESIARYEKAKANGTLDEEFPLVTKVYKDPIAFEKLPHTCSPDKALMRVELEVDWEDVDGKTMPREYIQTICPCGKVLSSNEIKE